MKKIIKNKKKDFGVQEFSCEVCSSVFETDDYSIWRGNIPSGKSSWRGMEFIPSFELETECPVCERNTRKYIPTGEPALWGSWELL